MLSYLFPYSSNSYPNLYLFPKLSYVQFWESLLQKIRVNRNHVLLVLDTVNSIQEDSPSGGILPELRGDKLNLCKKEIKHDEIKQFFHNCMLIHGRESWCKSPPYLTILLLISLPSSLFCQFKISACLCLKLYLKHHTLQPSRGLDKGILLSS